MSLENQSHLSQNILKIHQLIGYQKKLELKHYLMILINYCAIYLIKFKNIRSSQKCKC